MNALSDISLSPLQKLEEPCESWWIDWYPSGHAKPESVLFKSEKLRRPADDCEFIFSGASTSFNSGGADLLEHEPEQPAAVPCMAQDLEQEIAELEEQARSVDMGLDLDDFTGGLAYTHDSTSSLVTLGLEHQQVTDMLQIPAATSALCRKLKLPTLNVEAAKGKVAMNTTDPNDSNGGSRGDLTPTSEDDASTHISSSCTQASPHSLATHATSAFVFTSSPSKPSSAAAFPLAAIPHQTTIQPEHLKHIPSSSLSMSKANSLESNPSSSSLVAYSLPGFLTSEVQSEPFASAGVCTQQDMAGLCSQPKRASTAAAAPMPAKVPRLDRPRREAASARLQSTLEATVSGGLPGRAAAGMYKGLNDGRAGKAPAAKAGKGRGGKAAAGQQRGKKRMITKCAPPAPGVHACSQCGAQSTPVWRAGPFGPKTLCNACGVRYMKIAKKK